MTSSRPEHGYLLEQIRTTPVLVFSRVYCPYCRMAKNTLEGMGIHPTVVNLDDMPNADTILRHLEQITHQETVPNIFIGGKHIGGNSDLQEGLQKGSVQAKLQAAGIPFTST